MDNQEILLRDYWKVIYRRRFTAVTFFLVIVVAVTVFSFTASPVYRGTCDILIQRESPAGLNLEAGQDGGRLSSLEFLPTQYEIIKSSAVARMVVERLHLAENPSFNPHIRKPKFRFMELLQNIVGDFKWSSRYLWNAMDPESQITVLSEEVQKELGVRPVKNSQVTRIEFDSRDPELAAAVANAIAQAYIDLSLDMKVSASREAVQWLSVKIEEQRKKLNASEKALQAYVEQNDIVSIENKDAITSRKIQEVNTQLVGAETTLKELEASYEQLKKGLTDPSAVEMVPVVMNDPMIQSIRNEEIQVERKIDEMSKKYGPKHPVMIGLYAERNTISERKRKEINRVLNSVRSDLELARKREGKIKSLLGDTTSEAMLLSEKSIQYNVLKREVISNQQIFDSLFKRMNEISVVGDVRASNISVIDYARRPMKPVYPNKSLNLLLSLLVGLLGGMGMAFLVEHLETIVKTGEDVEQRLGLPLIGSIPVIDGGKTEGLSYKTFLESPSSVATEAYRGIRTSLMLAGFGKGDKKRILVTGSIAGEGKTTTAVNLALGFAQIGKRVLLVDGDMRKPTLHKIFKLPNEEGFSTVLSNMNTVQNVVREVSSNLWVLTSGSTPANPTELMSTMRCEIVLLQASLLFDYVLIDSPPVSFMADSTILAGLVDGILLVVRSGKTTYDAVNRGLRNLQSAEVPILGAVLNGLSEKAASYGYYYPYGDTKKETPPGARKAV